MWIGVLLIISTNQNDQTNPKPQLTMLTNNKSLYPRYFAVWMSTNESVCRPSLHRGASS